MAKTIEFKAGSNVKSATLLDSGVLEVAFANKDVHLFEKVTEGMLDEWSKADSAGRWFHANIRSRPQRDPHLGKKTDAKTAAPAPSAPSSDAPAVEQADPAPAAPAPEASTTVAAPEAPKPSAPPARATTLAIDVENCSPDVRACAEAMYVAYTDNSKGLNYEGKPCPKWADLTSAVQSHWCASAIAAVRRLESMLVKHVEQLELKVAELEARKPAAAAPRGGAHRPWRP